VGAANEGERIYTVNKVYRASRQEVHLLGVYYVLNGVIFQAPPLNRVIDFRIQNLVEKLGSVQDKIKKGADVLYSQTTTWKHLNQMKENQELDFGKH